jgi:hypothetical protein
MYLLVSLENYQAVFCRKSFLILFSHKPLTLKRSALSQPKAKSKLGLIGAMLSIRSIATWISL